MINKRLLVSLAAASLLALNFTGCGSSNKSTAEEPVQKTEVSGYLIDSAVVGASYECSGGMKGTTDSEGKFTCEAGDTVTFKVGSVTLGSASGVQNGTTVTPYTLAADNETVAVNIARLIQTLDVDSDPSNGIDVTENSKKLTTTIDLTAEDFATKAGEAIGIELKSATEAIAHMESVGITKDGTQLPTTSTSGDVPSIPSTTTSTSGGTTTTSTSGVTTSTSGILPGTETGGIVTEVPAGTTTTSTTSTSTTSTSTSSTSTGGEELPSTSTTSGDVTTTTTSTTSGGETTTTTSTTSGGETTTTTTSTSGDVACQNVNPITGACEDEVTTTTTTSGDTSTTSTSGGCQNVNPITGACED